MIYLRRRGVSLDLGVLLRMSEYDWEWTPEKYDPMPEPKKRLDLYELKKSRENEPWHERVLRMLFQLEKFCKQCSMCPLGCTAVKDHDTYFDPHVFSNMRPSKWVVVGQNPGYNECLRNTPFVGDAGKFFDDRLMRSFMKRDDFYITNVVKCYTINNAKPLAQHTSICESILRMELFVLKPVLVITLGAVSFNILCPDKKLSDNVGEIVKSDKFGVNVYPIFHPSPRNMSSKFRKNKFIEDVKKLCTLIKAYNNKQA
jgi:uracil-DNA glycosylase family 4